MFLKRKEGDNIMLVAASMLLVTSSQQSQASITKSHADSTLIRIICAENNTELTSPSHGCGLGKSIPRLRGRSALLSTQFA